MELFNVLYYKKSNGSCPFLEFYETLDTKWKARTLRLLLLLEENGNELREPYSKPLEDGIFELRVKSGNNISRALYFFAVGRKIIITHGFVKKTNKTPKKEINLAKEYRKDYLERNKRNE